MKKLFATLLLGLAVGSAAAQTAEEVRQDFFGRFSETAAREAAEAMMQQNLTPECLSALEFLYAYMPAPDMADYPLSYYISQTECALRARREMPWGTKIPEREWRHFVLPVRVNNENLDTFRTACYEELKQRVAGLSMRDAVLEVNHWCHEYVTYQPSDARTSAPLATMRTATGRCGEESTFTVSALRAIGIPARQVYTPRWAHTDDNHAWVEAWVDGKWYFLGACEPEPVLNLGWFNQPASRGMLMHTKVYGRYDGPEDVISRTPCYTEINVTSNYAPVARTTVVVTDTAGQPVPGARVEFGLYNYAQFYTVCRALTDSAGCASITAGLGDLLAWAARDGRYGFAKFTVGSADRVSVCLDHRAGDSFSLDLDVTPPAGRNNLPQVPEAAVRANDHRKAVEDSIRTAYVRTFPDSARIAGFARQSGLDFARIRPLVEKSRGNYAATFALLERYGTDAATLLETVSDKDLRDFELPVLADHLTAARAGADSLGAWVSSPTYRHYVLSPRIANERLTPWRSYLQQAFTAAERDSFSRAPERLALWVMQRVRTDSLHNPLQLCLSPEAALRCRLADVAGQGLLFVAAARSLNVAARIDEVTGKVQYATDRTDAPRWQTVPFDDQQWRKAILAQEKVAQARRQLGLTAEPAAAADTLAAPAPQAAAARSGRLTLTYTPRQYMENPKYYSHFTLSRLDNGLPVLLNYPENDTWQRTFSHATAVDAGDYLLTSGTRMADGSVLAHLAVFPVRPGHDVEVPLVMREDQTGLQVIGGFNSENLYFDAGSQAVKSILSTTGRGYFVVGLLRANNEPSNHILHDLEKLHADLEKWGRPILLLFPSHEELERFEHNRSEFPNLPATVRFGVDSEGAVAADLFGSGLVPSRETPLLVLGDTFNRVVFCVQGYTIGVGEQIKQAVKKLN